MANKSYILIPSEPGPFHPLDVQEAFIEVDTSEVWEVGPSVSNVHLSYWLPNNTISGEKVPVIAVISPVFLLWSARERVWSHQCSRIWACEFIFENFIPHGYAFAK